MLSIKNFKGLKLRYKIKYILVIKYIVCKFLFISFFGNIKNRMPIKDIMYIDRYISKLNICVYFILKI